MMILSVTYMHKILAIIKRLLIDEDYYTGVEGREIISNLPKAAGFAHMVSTMQLDIDHTEECVRNTTAYAFSVVASALGIPSLLPFLKAVCRSKKSGVSHWDSDYPTDCHHDGLCRASAFVKRHRLYRSWIHR